MWYILYKSTGRDGMKKDFKHVSNNIRIKIINFDSIYQGAVSKKICILFFVL